MKDPIALPEAKGQTCDWNLMVTGAKDLSDIDMDAESDSYRNAYFKWDGAP
jgi:hypothetical protein